ncbi:hypothetical protein WG908_04475 [Sphingobium sp. AN641]|uniref:hypothetical protein n=1 Tax=Sphingobium sp. AN641 TaxID=3133443 RepID=UPI0030C54870
MNKSDFLAEKQNKVQIRMEGVTPIIIPPLINSSILLGMVIGNRKSFAMLTEKNHANAIRSAMVAMLGASLLRKTAKNFEPESPFDIINNTDANPLIADAKAELKEMSY